MNVIQYFPNISQEDAHFASLALLMYGLFRYKKHPNVSEYYEIVKAAFHSPDGSDYEDLYIRLRSINRDVNLQEMIADILDGEKDQVRLLKELSSYLFLAVPIEKQRDVINACIFRVK
jgi:hypothetical protein